MVWQRAWGCFLLSPWPPFSHTRTPFRCLESSAVKSNWGGGEKSQDQEELRVAGLFLALGPSETPLRTVGLLPDPASPLQVGAHKGHSLTQLFQWIEKLEACITVSVSFYGLNIYICKRRKHRVEEKLSYLLPHVNWFKSQFVPVDIAGSRLVIRSLQIGVNHCHLPLVFTQRTVLALFLARWKEPRVV